MMLTSGERKSWLTIEAKLWISLLASRRYCVRSATVDSSAALLSLRLHVAYRAPGEQKRHERHGHDQGHAGQLGGQNYARRLLELLRLQRELALPFLLHALDDHPDVFHGLTAGPGLEKCDRPCCIARVVAADRLTQLVQLLDDPRLQRGEGIPLHRVVREGGFDLGERRQHGVHSRSMGQQELRVAR
jgi:hypothetical protein